MNGSPYPLDFQTEQASLAKKQALGQMLQQMAMQGTGQGQMVSGHYVAPGIASMLAPMVQGFMSQKIGGEVTAGQQALNSQYSSAVGDALKSYHEKSQQDPLAAAQEAMTSQLAPIKELGISDYKQLAEAMKPIVADKNIYQKDIKTGNFTQLTDNSEHFGDLENVKNAAGDLQFDPVTHQPVMAQRDLQTNKNTYLPQHTPAAIINTGDNKELGGVISKRLDDSFSTAQSKQSAVKNLDAAGDILHEGIYSGSAAHVALGMAKVGKALGIADSTPEMVNTEAFQNAMKRQVIALAKPLGAGTGFSDTDRKFLESMTGSEPTLEPQSILRLINLAKADAHNTVQEHNRLVGKAYKAFPDSSDKVSFYELPQTAGVSEDPASGGVYLDKKSGVYRVGGATPPVHQTTPLQSPVNNIRIPGAEYDEQGNRVLRIK